uniref:uncharacterized protein LOC122597701 n=1 Tax=Erigeron canadensis TaxID=72917 RepID=UPI001CB9A32B|nr:uncharacterized protein LOC122597701 [Erigeron canadensis]
MKANIAGYITTAKAVASAAARFGNRLRDTDTSYRRYKQTGVRNMYHSRFPLVQPIPGYRKTIQPPETSSEPSLEVMRYLYPDYDPSDPSAPVTPRNPKIPFKPLVFLNEDHKKFMLDLQADCIKKQAEREAEDKRRKEKSLDDLINRNLAKLFPASSGTKADQNLGDSSSTIV